MTDHDRLDLSGLDPAADPARLERIMGRLMSRSASELTRRRATNSVLGQIAWWERPVLMAAAILGLVSLSTLALVSRGAKRPSPSGWSSAIGVPAQLTGWVEVGQIPTLESAFGIDPEAP